MKKIIPFIMCVFLFLVTINVDTVYACTNETMNFNYNGKIFTYSLIDNIKSSNQFDLNYEINKYNRFSTQINRIKLLEHLNSIGIEKKIALEYLFPNLSKTIKKIEKNIYIRPKNASLKIDPNSQRVFSITPEIVGINLDKNTLIEQIFNSYINAKPLNFSIPTTKIYPSKTKEDLTKFTNLRSDFSTNIASSSKDRKHNIKNALMSLNKIEIYPNEIFSFNKIVGKRTKENGYREAKIIVNNEFVDGIGGGVCQVSTTLYNAALLAGLEIVESNKHSKQISYVKSGFDAMVNFGSSDLKFKNNTNQKLTIITNYNNNYARIRIFGENMNNTTYKLSNEIINVVEPNEEILFDENKEHLEKVKFEDEFFYLKNPSKGMEIKTYREKYENNHLISKELLRHDKFKVQNGIKIFGTEKKSHKIEV